MTRLRPTTAPATRRPGLSSSSSRRWATTCFANCAAASSSCSTKKAIGPAMSSETRSTRTGWRIWSTRERCSARDCVSGPCWTWSNRSSAADCKLSSLNARSADPGTDVGQPLHVDMGAIADEKGYWVCNTVWLLDDFTRDNGPTRMIPGSHKWGTRPQDVMSDPYAPHPQEMLLIAPAGTDRGDERAHVARRNRESKRLAAPRDARVLLPARQAAAAISEAAAAPGGSGVAIA